METGKILEAIFIPIGIILVIAFLFYFFGNVYNGLIKRKDKAEHSYFELCQALDKSFKVIPSLIQEVKMTSAIRDELSDIYKRYRVTHLKDMAPHEAASLDEMYQSCLEELAKQNYHNEIIDFITESRRLSKFSIPLYNHNVHDYIRFKNMFINKTVAKIFKFKEIEAFKPTPEHGNTTIDFRLDEVIK